MVFSETERQLLKIQTRAVEDSRDHDVSVSLFHDAWYGSCGLRVIRLRSRSLRDPQQDACANNAASVPAIRPSHHRPHVG